MLRPCCLERHKDLFTAVTGTVWAHIAVHVCTCVCTRVHSYACTYVRPCARAVCEHLSAGACACTCPYTCAYVCTHILCAGVHACARVHICAKLLCAPRARRNARVSTCALHACGGVHVCPCSPLQAWKLVCVCMCVHAAVCLRASRFCAHVCVSRDPGWKSRFPVPPRPHVTPVRSRPASQ